VLVAEPSRTLVALIRATLNELPVELEVASDGPQAFSMARMRVPDLVICDERLPGLDGYALSHAIRQLHSDRPAQVLMLVAEHATPDPERLAYVGVTDVLGKPFERAVLLERVRGLLPELSRPALPPALEPQPTWPSPATWPREPARPETRPDVRPDVRPDTRIETRTESRIDAEALVDARLRQLESQLDSLVETRLAALVETRLAALVDARMGPMLSQRLPSLVDAALVRIAPQLAQAAVDRAVAERVPTALQAVHDAAQATLAELTNPAQVEAMVANLARDAVMTALGRELMTLVPTALAEVKAHIESELLSRLDKFARTELPQKLTSHAEQIVWKVVPTLAEDIVKEEIKRLTAE
jgi:DNA-binding response OmpR family regulator